MARYTILHPFFLVLLSFAIASSILAHHFLSWGRVIDWGDMLHHEFFAFTSIAFGVGVIVTIMVMKRGHPHG